MVGVVYTVGTNPGYSAPDDSAHLVMDRSISKQFLASSLNMITVAGLYSNGNVA
ncbi:Uncharacterised protein (plasmid) [Klebsiella aerogenes]|nr:Uncharacterised protein [Klebsiella aerogenes]